MKVLILITFIFSLNAHSEYRVYQYVASNKVTTASDQPKSKITQSTLDPVSYVAYNGGSNIVSVELMRTWICPGHTGNGKPLCPSPYLTTERGL